METVSEKKLKLAAEFIISAIGEDKNDPNFIDTPKRFAKSFLSLFRTKEQIEEEVSVILNTAFPSGGYDGMIFCTGILTYSFCPHHLLPIEYETTIGYIPSAEGKVIGASKLPRLVDLFCKRAMLQEELTKSVADAITNFIHPDGIAVVIKGKHDCMRIRGIKQQDSKFETSDMRGSFRDNAATREEFFHLITKS
jgi:GTP cyclohydrolase I